MLLMIGSLLTLAIFTLIVVFASLLIFIDFIEDLLLVLLLQLLLHHLAVVVRLLLRLNLLLVRGAGCTGHHARWIEVGSRVNDVFISVTTLFIVG